MSTLAALLLSVLCGFAPALPDADPDPSTEQLLNVRVPPAVRCARATRVLKPEVLPSRAPSKARSRPTRAFEGRIDSWIARRRFCTPA